MRLLLEAAWHSALCTLRKLPIVRHIETRIAPQTASGPPYEWLRYISVEPAFLRYLDRVPPAVAAVPSMISMAEKRLLFGLAADYCCGDGIIVDAGILLGASTCCFGEGLKQNRNLDRLRSLRPRPIISFEKGDVTPPIAAFLRMHQAALPDLVGEQFIEATKVNIASVQDLVDLRVGDILDDPLDLACPVELCFLDILKSPEISLHCFEKLVPLLIPGRSLVVHQDYFYEKLPFIKTHQEFLGDHFDFVGEVGSTAIFRLASPVPPEKLAGLANVIVDEQMALADVAVQRSRDPYRRLMMSLSKVRLIAKLKSRKEAGRYLEQVKAEYAEHITGTPPSRIVDALSDTEAICRFRKARAPVNEVPGPQRT